MKLKEVEKNVKKLMLAKEGKTLPSSSSSNRSKSKSSNNDSDIDD